MKITIENQSSLLDEECLLFVREVMRLGRISNGGYCFATTFEQGVAVYALKNKKSDRFIVRDCE